jgi:glycosyltransferase involved in cell wall biosynthesis
MKENNLLFLAPRFPFPPHSGERLRVFNLLRELSRSYSVTLLSLGDADDHYVHKLKEKTGIKNVVTFRVNPLMRGIGLLKSIIFGSPLQLGYFDVPVVRKWLQNNSKDFSVGVFHLLRAGQYQNDFLGDVRVLEMCDANSEIFRQNTLVLSWFHPWAWISRYEAARMLRLEREAVSRFDLITLHTAHDATIIAENPERIFVSTQGVDLAQYEFISPRRRDLKALIFFGKMDFFPNFDGILWFINNVLPLLSDDFKLVVVGVCPPSTAKKLLLDKRVELTGRVESIPEAARRGGIGIAPIRSAAGVQNKVLEYFALGLPAVATKNVVKGLCVGAEEATLVADSPDEWVAAITRLRSSVDFSEAMAVKGRSYVERSHDWAIIGADYRDRLARLSPCRLTSNKDVFHE